MFSSFNHLQSRSKRNYNRTKANDGSHNTEAASKVEEHNGIVIGTGCLLLAGLLGANREVPLNFQIVYMINVDQKKMRRETSKSKKVVETKMKT